MGPFLNENAWALHKKQEKNFPSFRGLSHKSSGWIFVCLLFNVALPERGDTQMSADTSARRGPAHNSAHWLLAFVSHLLQDRSLQKSSQAHLSFLKPATPVHGGWATRRVLSPPRPDALGTRTEAGKTLVPPARHLTLGGTGGLRRGLRGLALPADARGRMRLTRTNPPHTHTQASAGPGRLRSQGSVRNWRPAVPGHRGQIGQELVTGRWQEERAEAPSSQHKIYCPKVKHKFNLRISRWQPQSAKLQEWCPSQRGILNGFTSYMFMKLVLSGEKGWKACILCLWIIAKVSRFFIISFLQKCQEETVRFLAMQKLCDFGNWELLLEAQHRACSYSLSNNSVEHLIASNNSHSPTEGFRHKQQKQQGIQ